MEKYEEVIKSYNEYLSKVPKGINYIINNLKDGNHSLALKAIVDFSEGLVWMEEVAQVLNKSDINVDFKVSAVEGFLEEVNSGLEKEDYLLVSDIFEYELWEFFSSLSPIKYTN